LKKLRVEIIHMNAGIFRLVYNQFRALWMVVSECATSHQSSSKSTSKSTHSRHAQFASQALLIVVISGASASLFAAPLAPNAIPTGLVVKNGNININAPVVNPANQMVSFLRLINLL
jgi:cytochrome b561